MAPEAFHPQDPNSKLMTPESGTNAHNPWEAEEETKFPVGAAVKSPVIGLAPDAPTQPQALRGPEPGKPQFIEQGQGIQKEPITPQVLGGQPAYRGEPTPVEPIATTPNLPGEGFLQEPTYPQPNQTSELPQKLLNEGGYNQYATSDQVREHFLGGAVDPDREITRLDEELPVPNFNDPKKQNLLQQLGALIRHRQS